MDNQNKSQHSTQNTKVEVDNSTVMGILSYLGILVVIPLIVSKNNSFVKFHTKQGLVLLAVEIILWIAMRIAWVLMPLIGLLELVVFIFAIIGIINVVEKKEKELPFIGSFSKHINI